MAQLIDRYRDEILADWEASVRRLTSARGLSRAERLNLMSELLALLGRGDPQALPALSDEQHQLLERQVANRLRQGFVLNDILTEYGVLGRSIVRRAGAAAPASEHQRLLAELRLAYSAVTTVFNEHMLEDEQVEKHYRRLIDDVANDAAAAPSTGTPPLSERAHQMLELVMAAVGADTADLLLHDEASGNLLVAAWAGDARAPTGRPTSAHDTSTFPGLVASRPAEATMADVETTPLRIDDGLRQGGIRSLLGVPLVLHGALRGVIYLGTRERRAFSPSDVRRLEALGETLARHLTGARQPPLRQEATRDPRLAELLHELGEPLASAMSGVAALLENEEGAGDVRGVAGAIGADLLRLDRIVSALLDAHRASGR
jgi:hypothetical protein